MKKYIILLFVVCCQHFNSNADNIRFDTIPENLKKDADAIIRYDNSKFNITSISSAKYIVKTAITVLNKRGDKFAKIYVFYDKFQTINNIEGNVFDSKGELIESFNKDDFYDRSISSSGTSYDDNRIKIYDAAQIEYPYTVEYEFEKNYTGYISIPYWKPISSYNIAVQNSTRKINIYPGTDIHYKALNIDQEPEIKKFTGLKTYEWSIDSLPAVKYEPYSPYLSEYTPMVYFAPNKFYFDGYSGFQSTWNDIGFWAYQLMLNRDQVSQETIAELMKVVSVDDSDIEKTKKIYKYLQSKTRYISIQLGIGGFQPFTALEVDQLGYGDCKALSNYMVALLKVVDIKAHYTIIGAGDDHIDLFEDFASISQMNHAIVCVPLESDTVWLECTSQTNPFGYLSDFTDDRYALLITPEGGKLARTKKYDKSDNLQSRTVNVALKVDGSVNAKLKTTYSCLQYDFVEDQFYEGPEEQRKNLYEDIDLANLEIVDFKYSQKKDLIPTAYEYLDLKINKYASKSGKRLFLPLNILNRQSYIPKKVKDRKSDVDLDFAYTDYDTVKYEIPEQFTVEFLPDTNLIVSPFGEYLSYVIQNENTLEYIRINKRNEGRFPKEEYPNLIRFYKKIRKADKQKAILIEKE
jgi:transglutaminase-like putative cysteine protease